jgi:hypothetical protein
VLDLSGRHVDAIQLYSNVITLSTEDRDASQLAKARKYASLRLEGKDEEAVAVINELQHSALKPNQKRLITEIETLNTPDLRASVPSLPTSRYEWSYARTPIGAVP